jgi:hypothetical protein
MPRTVMTPEELAFDRYFKALLWEYRRRDFRDEARAALRKALAEGDPEQTRCLIFDAVVAERGGRNGEPGLVENPRPENLETLAEFIEAGSWRAENLPLQRGCCGGRREREVGAAV